MSLGKKIKDFFNPYFYNDNLLYLGSYHYSIYDGFSQNKKNSGRYGQYLSVCKYN
jgi:hypothetical protein